MPAKYCPICNIRMAVEFDHEEEKVIWHCSECGETIVQGEDDD